MTHHRDTATFSCILRQLYRHLSQPLDMKPNREANQHRNRMAVVSGNLLACCVHLCTLQGNLEGSVSDSYRVCSFGLERPARKTKHTHTHVHTHSPSSSDIACAKTRAVYSPMLNPAAPTQLSITCNQASHSLHKALLQVFCVHMLKTHMYVCLCVSAHAVHHTSGCSTRSCSTAASDATTTAG